MTTGKFLEILTPYPLSAFGADLPGDGMKRNPERETWPCSYMLPDLPIQSISG